MRFGTIIVVNIGVMKKAEIIEKITDILKGSGAELRTEMFEDTLRNGRWGFHCYAIRYDNGEVYAIPFAKANACWKVDWKKLTKADLLSLLVKAENLL